MSFNRDKRFSSNTSWVFMAQQYVERERLEKEINVISRRGFLSGSEQFQSISMKDHFSIFKKIRGSPKYWQEARYELMAKIEQLGPFQLFFTLSCAEMRWEEVFTTILSSMGHEITFPATSVNQSEPTVNGVPL